MSEDTKLNAPIEIVIRVDPTAAGQAIKRGAKETRRLATSRPAVLCYWIAAAAVFGALAIVVIPPHVIGKFLGIGIVAGIGVLIVALKRRYSPLIPD